MMAITHPPIVLLKPGDIYHISGLSQAWLRLHGVDDTKTYLVEIFSEVHEAHIYQFEFDEHERLRLGLDPDVMHRPPFTTRVKEPLPSIELARELVKVTGGRFAHAS